MKKINGKYLKKLREEHGYSLRVFAEMIYVSKSTVQRWEQSFLPENEELLTSIASIFGMSAKEMYRHAAALYGTETQRECGDMPALNDASDGESTAAAATSSDGETGVQNAIRNDINTAEPTADGKKIHATGTSPEKSEKISLKAKLIVTVAALLCASLFLFFVIYSNL